MEKEILELIKDKIINGSDEGAIQILKEYRKKSFSIIERINTIEDACLEIGRDIKIVLGISNSYKRAQECIEIFAEALREGKPAGECFCCPYFLRSSAGGFSCNVYDNDNVYSFVGARLRVDTAEKAKHLGNCMIEHYKILDKG